MLFKCAKHSTDHSTGNDHQDFSSTTTETFYCFSLFERSIINRSWEHCCDSVEDPTWPWHCIWFPPEMQSICCYSFILYMSVYTLKLVYIKMNGYKNISLIWWNLIKDIVSIFHLISFSNSSANWRKNLLNFFSYSCNRFIHLKMIYRQRNLKFNKFQGALSGEGRQYIRQVHIDFSAHTYIYHFIYP